MRCRVRASSMPLIIGAKGETGNFYRIKAVVDTRSILVCEI